MRRSPTDRHHPYPRGWRAGGGTRAAAARCGLALGVAFMLGGFAAHAQPAPDAGAGAGAGADARANDDPEALIGRGVELRRHGDDQGALPLLRAAFDRGRTPRAAAQLGFVEQALGIWVDAEAHLAAAAAAPGDPWVGQHANLLEESLAFVRRHIGALVIESTVAGAEISVDGVAAGRAPLPAPLRLATGERRIEARVAGFPPFVATVTVRAGKTTRVAATIGASPAEPARATSPPPGASPHGAPALTTPPLIADPTITAPPVAPPPIAAPPVVSTPGTAPPMASPPPASLRAAQPPSPASGPPGAGGTGADAGAPGTPPRPLYTRWWLWTGIAAVLVGVGVALATTGGPDPYPCGGNGRVCAR